MLRRPLAVLVIASSPLLLGADACEALLGPPPDDDEEDEDDGREGEGEGDASEGEGEASEGEGESPSEGEGEGPSEGEGEGPSEGEGEGGEGEGEPFPTDARVQVRLTWDTATGDLDIHLSRVTPPSWCNTNDCYYGNCQNGTSPDWGSAPGNDPRIDIDDLSGLGPELLVVDEPADGVYTAGVVFFSGTGLTPTATVEIFVDGSVAFSDTRQFTATSQMWQPAQINVASGSITVTPLNAFEEAFSCF